MTDTEIVARIDREYRKTATIRATQWFKMGDHPAVVERASGPASRSPTQYWIDTLEGGHIVTPGDWIATGVKGEHWPIKPDVFAASYEPLEATSAQPARDVEGERSKQARWLSSIIIEAGQDLPSRQKWDSIRKLAAQFLKLLESDRAVLAPPNPDPADRALVERLRRLAFEDDGTIYDEAADRIEALSSRPPEAEIAREGALKRGDRVRKISGSSWRGIVVGEYSTALTPEGYAVESENEPGSVQIYPGKALAAFTPAKDGSTIEGQAS